MRRSNVLVALTLAVALLGACGDDESPSASTAGEDSGVSVHTAAELEEVVELVLDAYRAENPGPEIEVVVQDKSELTSALSERTVDRAILPNVWLDEVDDAPDATPFGRNLAVIVVPSGNPGGVTGLDAFAPAGGLATAICGEEPGADYLIRLLLSKSGVTPSDDAVSRSCADEVIEPLDAGELDAGLALRFRLTLPDGVEVIEIPDDQNVVIDLSYVAVGSDEDVPGLAAFLETPAVRDLLTEHGLLP